MNSKEKKTKRKLVLGDVHGSYKALMQVFSRSKFDYEKDELIFLGDLVDGWPEVKECFDEFLKIKNLIFIMGNHDEWALSWMLYGNTPMIWVSQGGKDTLASFSKLDPYTSRSQSLDPYIKLLNKAIYYYIDENRLFVHGGIPHYLIDNSVKTVDKEDLMWDRSLFELARRKHCCRHLDETQLTIYKEVYLGHTTTEHFSTKPQPWLNVWALDQGAGWGGRLTLMDVDTKEYFQSDLVTDLYYTK